jgi:8-oxo-dGTP pyrophosphatase MutT (NUDIX family)
MSADLWPEVRQGTSSVFLLRSDGAATRMAMLWHQGLGQWLVPGGHIEDGETPAEAASREVLEEVGYRIVLYDASAVRVSAASGERPVAVPLAIAEEIIPATGDQPEHVHVDHLFAARLVDEVAGPAETRARWVGQGELRELPTFRLTREIGQMLLVPGSQLARAALTDGEGL